MRRSGVSIRLANQGDAIGVFQVWSTDPAHQPRSYTVEPGKHLDDTWVPPGTGHDPEVFGPNGFEPGSRWPRVRWTPCEWPPGTSTR